MSYSQQPRRVVNSDSNSRGLPVRLPQLPPRPNSGIGWVSAADIPKPQLELEPSEMDVMPSEMKPMRPELVVPSELPPLPRRESSRSSVFVSKPVSPATPPRTPTRRRPPPPPLPSTAVQGNQIYTSPFVGDATLQISKRGVPSNLSPSERATPRSPAADAAVLSRVFVPEPRVPSTPTRISTGSTTQSSAVALSQTSRVVSRVASQGLAQAMTPPRIPTGSPPPRMPSDTLSFPTTDFCIDLLQMSHLKSVNSIYLLSHIYTWLLQVYFEWYNEYVISQIEFWKLVQVLLEYHCADISQHTVDESVDHVIASLVYQGAVVFEGDTVFLVPGIEVSGVFTSLLQPYGAEKTPNHMVFKSVGKWVDYWKFSEQELAEIDPKEVQKQSFIFDLLLLEEKSMNLAHCAIEVYAANYTPSLIPQEPGFAKMAFEIWPELVDLHRSCLLQPLLNKLHSEGRFISGVAPLYINFVAHATKVYVKYARCMAVVNDIIMCEREKGGEFARWLQEMDNREEVRRSKLYHDVIFFSGFFKSLQNIPLTLMEIRKWSSEQELTKAIEKVQELSRLVDIEHGKAQDMQRGKRLLDRVVGVPGIRDHKVIKYGSAVKKRDLWLDPTEVYLILIDTALLITEQDGGSFKLAEPPIPTAYLNVETSTGTVNGESTFKIRNTSTNVSYTLTSQVEWIAILVAASKVSCGHKVVSNAFAYPSTPSSSSVSSPEQLLSVTQVLCVVSTYFGNDEITLVGTDDGLYLPHRRLAQLPRVTQMVPCFGGVMVVSDRRLLFFPLAALFEEGVGCALQVVNEKVDSVYFASDFERMKMLFVVSKQACTLYIPEMENATRLRCFRPYKKYKAPSSIHGVRVFNSSFILWTNDRFILYNGSFNDVGIVLPFDLDLSNPILKDISKNRMVPVTCYRDSNGYFTLVFDIVIVKINAQGSVVAMYDLDFVCKSGSEMLLCGESCVVQWSEEKTKVVLKGKKVRLVGDGFVVMDGGNGRQTVVQY